jgi:hypothetical protein
MAGSSMGKSAWPRKNTEEHGKIKSINSNFSANHRGTQRFFIFHSLKSNQEAEL